MTLPEDTIALFKKFAVIESETLFSFFLTVKLILLIRSGLMSIFNLVIKIDSWLSSSVIDSEERFKDSAIVSRGSLLFKSISSFLEEQLIIKINVITIKIKLCVLIFFTH